MARVSPTWIADVRGHAAQRTPQLPKAPKREAASSYSPIYTASAPSAPLASRGIWSSIALKFTGFDSGLKSAIQPLKLVSGPKAAASYFKERLPGLVDLTSRHPSASLSIILKELAGARPLWRDLALVACGYAGAVTPALDGLEGIPTEDAIHVADCVIAAAGHSPKEGRHLIRHLFARLDIHGQLHMIESLAESGGPFSKELVGELFVKMMEASAACERRELVYPRIIEILAKAHGKKSPRHGFLGSLLKGWMLESPAGNSANIKKIDALLG